MARFLKLSFVVLVLVASTSVAAQTKVCSNPKCHSGKVYCDDCGYVGTVKGNVCAKCKGVGSYPCPTCNGKSATGGNTTDTDSTTGSLSPAHWYTCPECKGAKTVPIRCTNPKCHNGAIYCEACDYKGTISHRCETCDGSGEVLEHAKTKCSKCNGKKYVTQEEQIKCIHCRNGKRPTTQRGKAVYVDCNVCQGKGYKIEIKKVACPVCKGRPYAIERNPHTEKCKACNGEGSVADICSKCNGKACYPCPTCDGYANIQNPCSRCNGKGVIYAK